MGIRLISVYWAHEIDFIYTSFEVVRLAYAKEVLLAPYILIVFIWLISQFFVSEIIYSRKLHPDAVSFFIRKWNTKRTVNHFTFGSR